MTKINQTDIGTAHATDRGVSLGIFSGKPFYVFQPYPEEIELEDIAQALAKQCRFNGHTKEFYSVAQHSVLVSELYEDVDTALWGLLHDAAEAYLGDCVRPLKRELRDRHGIQWDRFEEPILQAVAKRFQLIWPIPEVIIEGDNTLLATEKRDVLRPQTFAWGPLPAPLPEKIEPWDWKTAYHLFNWRFDSLINTR